MLLETFSFKSEIYAKRLNFLHVSEIENILVTWLASCARQKHSIYGAFNSLFYNNAMCI